MGQTTVRLATPDDFPAICEVARLSWCSTYCHILSETAIMRFLGHAYTDYTLSQTLRGGGLLVLEHTLRIIGFLRLSVHEGSAYVGAIYLLPEMQGRGFGRILWGATLEWAESRNLRAIRLTVAEGNTQARAFYQHLGFLEEKSREVDIGGEMIREISCSYSLTQVERV